MRFCLFFLEKLERVAHALCKRTELVTSFSEAHVFSLNPRMCVRADGNESRISVE